MNTGGIYQIRNLTNNKLYVGSTFKFEKRFREHRAKLRGNYHHCKHLQAAWNKYGESYFVFEILENVNESSFLIEREQFWIDKLNAYKEGYNVLPNAGSTTGMLHSEETKLKISIARKGISHSEAAKLRISIANKGKPGQIITKEGRLRLSLLRTGMKYSEETCRKISESKKGNIPSEETRLKMSISQRSIDPVIRARMNADNAIRGFTEDGLRRLSEAAKGRSVSKETRDKMSKAKTGTALSPETIAKRQATRKRNSEIANAAPTFASSTEQAQPGV